MDQMNDEKAVRRQYETSQNLDIRISLHARYSTNQQGFGNWIFEQYHLKEGDRILELGCGNGDMWAENIHRLPKGASLFLTDFSKGMVEAARAGLPQKEQVKFACADIQEIPCETESMDVVIANMMLYHVPDLDRGLREVERVLKPGGYSPAGII